MISGSSQAPNLPEEFRHIFTDVFFQLIPEVSYDDLVYLSQLVKSAHRQELYEPLADALRHIQWAKLAGMKAVAIEKDIASQIESDTILCEPYGQMEHADEIFGMVTHCKAALDLIAVFLTTLFGLNAKKGQRDFKHERFRKQIRQADGEIAKAVMLLELWLNELQQIRDEWIHWSSTRVPLILGPSPVGILPIPKKLSQEFKSPNAQVTIESHWSTGDFVKKNYLNLVSLFNAIVTRCIELEAASLQAPPSRPQPGETPMAAFPFLVTQNTHFKKLKLGRITQTFLGGDAAKS